MKCTCFDKILEKKEDALKKQMMGRDLDGWEKSAVMAKIELIEELKAI